MLDAVVDNGTREGLDKFLKAASSELETVLHYEFMQDYKVHLKHLDGHIEEATEFLYFRSGLILTFILLHPFQISTKAGFNNFG
ncbi:hypothetical protein COLO4_07239 [Corchorus olitorius]|uniref:Uncharacterized protein n=1 Tax=Corchorus olitorius TaxID=93759 RepID=A0A1R3KKB6_9ROSI|nr:hypothetical protein COLO4_07239 [Corchorus olitorius]